MISDERLDAVAKMKTHPMVLPPNHNECIEMAKELLAYRKAFSVPAVWVHGPTGIPLVNPDVREELKLCPASIPLYRKPTIPE